MDPKVQQILSDRAESVCRWMKHGKHVSRSGVVNDFANWEPGQAWQEIKRPREGDITFQLNDHAYVQFKDIQPDKVTRINVFPPKLLNKKKNDSATTEVINDSPAVLERSYQHTTSHTTTQNEDVGVSVTAGFEQKISYGGSLSPTSGETSFSLSVNASYNKSKGTSSTTSRDVSTSVEVPPYQHLFVTAESSVANYEQELEVFGTLEHSVSIFSHGDASFYFNGWVHLQDLIKGVANDDIYTWFDTHRDEYKRLAAKYRADHEWYNVKTPILSDTPFSYRHKTSFSNAISGDVRVTSNDIPQDA